MILTCLPEKFCNHDGGESMAPEKEKRSNGYLICTNLTSVITSKTCSAPPFMAKGLPNYHKVKFISIELLLKLGKIYGLKMMVQVRVQTQEFRQIRLLH